jgi:hypothetical protein
LNTINKTAVKDKLTNNKTGANERYLTRLFCCDINSLQVIQTRDFESTKYYILCEVKPRETSSQFGGQRLLNVLLKEK